MPAVSASSRTTPPTPAARRGSESSRSSIRLGSVLTGLREGYVAGFPAIRAIIQAVHAQVYVVHAFADCAVLFARTVVLRLVALRTQDWTVRHCCLQQKLYLSAKHGGKKRRTVERNVFVMHHVPVRRLVANRPVGNARQKTTPQRRLGKSPPPGRTLKKSVRCGRPEIRSAWAPGVPQNCQTRFAAPTIGRQPAGPQWSAKKETPRTPRLRNRLPPPATTHSTIPLPQKRTQSSRRLRSPVRPRTPLYAPARLVRRAGSIDPKAIPSAEPTPNPPDNRRPRTARVLAATVPSRAQDRAAAKSGKNRKGS